MIKKLILLLLCILFCCVPVLSQVNVSLAWDANVETYVAGYNVYRSNQSGNYANPVNPQLITTTSYTDQNLAYNFTYYWIVKAVSMDGTQSTASNEVTLTTTTNQGTVQNLKGSCDTAGNVNMSWDPFNGAESYYVRAQVSPAPADGSFIIYLDMYMMTQASGKTVPVGQTIDSWVHWYAGGVIMNSTHFVFTCPQAIAHPTNLTATQNPAVAATK
jgi:fibronectin type 3 domain-containing protein